MVTRRELGSYRRAIPPLTEEQLAGENLPARLARFEVCQLARYGETKLAAEIRAGRMPTPVGRGGAGDVFNRDAVLKALGIVDGRLSKPDVDPWIAAAEAYGAREAAWPKDSRGYRLSEKRARKLLGELAWAELTK